MKKLLTFFAAFVLSLGLYAQGEDNLRRVIVLTDIGGDVDDMQSMVRLLLYSNDLDIRGLIATTPNENNGLHPEILHKLVKTYGEVRPNLLLHDNRYPTAEHLDSLVRSGQPVKGLAGMGDGKQSEGADLIMEEVKKDDDRPLYISSWGATDVLAQALYTLRKTMSRKDLARCISKMRVYAISDQDDTGHWIRTEFPDLFYIVTPGANYGIGEWRGLMVVDSLANNEVISNRWILDNIQQGHGPLGALYPDALWGVEGDTPSYLWLIPNGLNNPEHPDWGGWGGRYELYKPELKDTTSYRNVPALPETRPIWTDAEDEVRFWKEGEFMHNLYWDKKTVKNKYVTIWRWREAFQNDFAARMDWCTKDYAEANHAPVPVLNVADELNVKSGDRIHFDAYDSYDPDGDHLSFLWMNYPEASTCKDYTMRIVWNNAMLDFPVPEVKKPETLHLILTVTDHGTPAMTRYKRIILHIKP